MDRLMIATSNRGKMRELKALLCDLKVQLIAPEDIGIDLSVREDGGTYRENAAKKAVAFASAAELICLADDSGLEVEVLGGAPGLHSARYVALPGATDADRRTQLLANLRGRSRPWRAAFRAAVAITVPGGETYGAEGECLGEIITEARGTGGFGYDPIFLVNGTGKTMAELTMDEKNRLSHRARAVAAAMPILRRLFPD